MAVRFHSDRRTHALPDFSSSAATAANRSGCRGARTIANFGSAASSRGHASTSAASSPSSVLPATTRRNPASFVFNCRVASASSAARTSNFRFPATATRSGAQPSAIRRSASISLCASTAAQPPQQRLPQPAQHLVARPRAIRDPRVHHRHGNSAAKASVQQIRPELCLRQNQHPRLERIANTRAPPTAGRAGNKTRDSPRSAPGPAPVRCAWWSKSPQNTPAAPHPAPSPAG